MTHHIRLPDDRVAILGALDLEHAPDGSRPRPHDCWMDLIVSHAAGVRLSLCTAAGALTLTGVRTLLAKVVDVRADLAPHYLGGQVTYS
ncbi:hypothetical protein ACFWYW_28285 [Nonomuraea sp. NPDC059023]|uniref:hypothetical protein n=1 Tax=unclassified Nonomuraea TaxID=2593643 RepID=UPI00368D7E66